MRKMLNVLSACMLFAFFPASQGFAHTPLCSCYDNGDGTISWEGGFSDGSSATGVTIQVLNSAGKVLIKEKMNEDSEFTFETPREVYRVQFDAGPGHIVEVKGEEIAE